MAGLRAAWIAWRNERLSSPLFQQFSGSFLLTRPIARAKARGLFDLTAGFVYAQILSACVRLDLFERLRRGPQSAAGLAAGMQLPETSLRTLLDAASSLELLERVGEDYGLGSHGAALLGAAGLADMIRHHEAFYEDLRDPIELVRRGRGERLSRFWPYAVSESEACEVGPYSALMAATQPAVAADILSAYSMRSHRVVMDVGGGEGAFLSALGARWPHLKLRLFDLPAVVARAADKGVDAELIAGDFLNHPLPAGADLITLVRILHDQDDEGAMRLLKSARAALADGGRLLVAEPMIGRDRFAGAYLAMYLLAMGRGRPRRPDEIRSMLARAGFRRAKMLHVRTPELLRIILAN